MGMSKINVYIGTDTKRKSQGVYRMVLDTLKGSLEGPWLYYPCEQPKYLCHDHYELALIHASRDQAGVSLLDTHQMVPYHLDTQMSEQIPSCFVTMDQNFIYTANFHEGTLTIYRKNGKLRMEARIHLGEDAHCHQVLLLNGYIYVICLGLDCIKIFDSEDSFALVKEIVLPKGSGPRHAIIDAKQQYLYLLTQYSNEVFVYRIGTHFLFRCQQIVSVLPKGCKEECSSAAIRISPNGKYLYTSTRGADIITCFEMINGNLRQKEIMRSGGKHPRDFIIDETGRWMIVLNQESDHAVVFQLDPDRGNAIMITDEKEVPEGTCIALGYRI